MAVQNVPSAHQILKLLEEELNAFENLYQEISGEYALIYLIN